MRYGRDQKFVVLISRGVKFEIRTNLKFTIWYILFLIKNTAFLAMLNLSSSLLVTNII